MQAVERTESLQHAGADPLEPRELEHIAFIGQSEVAHGIFRSIAAERRAAFANKYVLSEVIVGGIRKLRTFLAASAEEAANDEKEFINETVELFVATAGRNGTTPRELFESLLLWSDELRKLSLLREALQYHDKALALGINKFPDLYMRCIIAKAHILQLTGKYREAEWLLGSLAERPYLITDRNLVPQLYFDLGQEALLRGNVSMYKRLLFRSLRHFSTRMETRKQIVDQIRTTYRYSLKVMLDRDISLTEKALYALHRTFFFLQDYRVVRVLGLARMMRAGLLGYVYALNYGRSSLKVSREMKNGDPGDRAPERSCVLITRAMGGIGDLLMMTPALHALKRKYPNREIHLAIPRRYFPLFQGNTDVRLIDIEQEGLDPLAYKKWFNLTDCPAARVESRTAPKVKRTRIELFARSMGIGWWRTKRMAKLPRYFVTPEDKAFQQTFWREHRLMAETVIGVQLHSDEVYRDYPHMPQLVARLAHDYHVIVFDTERIDGLEGERIVKVEGLPMRKAFALAAACDAIVAPDSSFVHLAAALDVPCVGLYGPIDGELRTKHYPRCVFLDVRSKLGCLPCWRNDRIPCKLTNLRTSVCLADISVQEIVNTVNNLLQKGGRR